MERTCIANITKNRGSGNRFLFFSGRRSISISIPTPCARSPSSFFFSYIIPPISIFMNGRTVGPEYGKLEARQYRNGKRGILIKPDNAQK